MVGCRLTFAMDEVDRECPFRDLLLDLGLEGGSEFAACMVGMLVIGIVPPGLADRDIRGHGIMPIYPFYSLIDAPYCDQQVNAVAIAGFLSLRHANATG